MSRPKVFPFYKHLVEQECRKDIIFENDFTNKRTQAANAPFFNKYKEMFMKNKMRLAYLAGFSAIFSLGYLYDVLFQSSFYTGLVDQTERLLMKIEGDNRQSRVDYRDRVAAELGRYFIRLEQLNLNRQITPAALSTRSPAFLQCQTEVFDVDSFVSFCLKHKVALEELPNPSRL